jgi:hypothetical protein
MLLNSHSSEVMLYEKPTLLKAYNTLLNVTLLEDFTILLQMGLIKGLWNIHLECHLVKGFTTWLINQPKSIEFILTITINRE